MPKTPESVVARESQDTLELPWHRNGLAVESDDRYVASFDSRGVNDEHDDELRLEFAIRACNSHQALVEALQATLIELARIDSDAAAVSLPVVKQIKQALRLAQGETK